MKRAKGPKAKARALAVRALGPDKRAQLLAAFATGKTRGWLATKFRVDRGVVHEAIKAAEASGNLPTVRKRMSAMLEQTLEDAFVTRSKTPHKLSGYEIGVLFDKWQLLEGQATQVVEVRSDRSGVADVVRRLQELASGTLPLVGDTAEGGEAGEKKA